MHPTFSLWAQMIRRRIQRLIQHTLATATAAMTSSVTTEIAYLTAAGVTTMTIVETTVMKRDVVCLSNILCIYYSAYSVNGVALPM